MKHKHQKTRKEKIIADYRHQVYTLKNKSSTDSVLDKNIPSNNPTLAIPVNENSYLSEHIIKDVLRTGILTCSIIAAQIILFILFKNHVISLPRISY